MIELLVGLFAILARVDRHGYLRHGNFRVKDNSFVPASPEARANLDEIAQNFTDRLRDYSLNVVTAESLTAGMIVSYLVDVPFRGAYIYGGHAVYDSDAKRVFLGVREPNVYTEACSRQMARGAIDSSRALVGVAVTGEAGPVSKSNLTVLGIVNYAISLKTEKLTEGAHRQGLFRDDPNGDSGDYETLHQRFEFCTRDGHDYTLKWCQQYMKEAEASPQGYVTRTTLAATRLAIRQETVYAALSLGAWFLDALCKIEGCPALQDVQPQAWDGHYVWCGEPSRIVDENLPVHFPIPSNATAHCPLPDMPYDKPWDCQCPTDSVLSVDKK